MTLLDQLYPLKELALHLIHLAILLLPEMLEDFHKDLLS